MWMCKSARRSARSIVCAGCQGWSSRECTGDRTFGPWRWTTATTTPVPPQHPHSPLGAPRGRRMREEMGQTGRSSRGRLRDHLCIDPPRAVGARGARCAVRRGRRADRWPRPFRDAGDAWSSPRASPGPPALPAIKRHDHGRCRQRVETVDRPGARDGHSRHTGVLAERLHRIADDTSVQVELWASRSNGRGLLQPVRFSRA